LGFVFLVVTSFEISTVYQITVTPGLDPGFIDPSPLRCRIKHDAERI